MQFYVTKEQTFLQFLQLNNAFWLALLYFQKAIISLQFSKLEFRIYNTLSEIVIRDHHPTWQIVVFFPKQKILIEAPRSFRFFWAKSISFRQR